MEKITHRRSFGKKMPKIKCETDYRDIRIYINDLLHIIIPRPSTDTVPRDSMWVQSYLTGSRKRKFYYIDVRHSGGDDTYGYDDFELWKAILKELDDNI